MLKHLFLRSLRMAQLFIQLFQTRLTFEAVTIACAFGVIQPSLQPGSDKEQYREQTVRTRASQKVAVEFRRLVHLFLANIIRDGCFATVHHVSVRFFLGEHLTSVILVAQEYASERRTGDVLAEILLKYPLQVPGERITRERRT